MAHFRSFVSKLWPASTAKKMAALIVFAVLASSGGFIAVSEQTGFCNSCHIMNPYYKSWQQSGHSEVNCLECHVQPGFHGIVRAKLNGLAQAVDCFLGRVHPKPNALVEDASCLRDGCHTKESLLSEPVAQVDQKYKFSHRGHIDAQLGSVRLLCTTCHSRFEGQEHFKVNTQNCLICHFLKAQTSPAHLVETKCLDCHDVPAEVFQRDRAEIDHRKFIASQLGCEQLCHSQQMDPNPRVADTQCLDCHEFRNQGEYGASELHAMHSGKDKVECLACHEMAEHGRRPIDGHHTSLKCDSCHEVPFEGARLAEIDSTRLPADCGLCHRDPHAGQFTKACQQCHSEHGWNGRWLASSHGPGSSFPLRGKHANVRCDQCHRIPENGRRLADARFVGLGRDCQACHADPHAGQMSSSCSTCHTETGWTGNNLLFSHNQQALFKLEGPHSALACDACHGQGEKRYRSIAHTCEDCHQRQTLAMQGTARMLSAPPDPHNGRLSCTDCHDRNKPGQGRVEYAAQCASCHNSRYGALFYSWANALAQRRASIQQNLKHLEEPNDARRLPLEQILEDAAAVGFHNLNLTQEILRAGTPAHPENTK